MKLKSFGCSFISGDELPDHHVRFDNTGIIDVRHSQLTFPALLAKHLDMEYECHAEGASGNLRIMRNVILETQRDPEPAFYVVQWSMIERYDYTLYADWPIGSWKTIMAQSTGDDAQAYYRHLHSEYRDKLTTLININTAIDLLSSLNYRFLMTYTDGLMFCQKWNKDPVIMYFQNKVQKHLRSFGTEHYYHDSWYNWCLRNQWPRGPGGHPLELAHQETFQQIIASNWV